MVPYRASYKVGRRGQLLQYALQRRAPIRLGQSKPRKNPAAIENRIGGTARRPREVLGGDRDDLRGPRGHNGLGKFKPAHRRLTAEMVCAPAVEIRFGTDG